MRVKAHDHTAKSFSRPNFRSASIEIFALHQAELFCDRGIFMLPKMEEPMADDSGASGILGVLVGVVLVIFIGAAVLMSTGKMGSSGPSFSISLPGAK